MFSLIESEQEIAKAQRKLAATIRRDFRKKAVRSIGYPGGTTSNAKVDTDGKHWYFSSSYNEKDNQNPRYFNWFGLFGSDASLDIVAEINTPFEGRNQKIAGFFARDNDTGSIYLMHSGRVGGGTRGVGKVAFLAWSDQRPVAVTDSAGGIREGVLVMPIEGDGAVRSAVRYVESISAFKQAVRAGGLDSPEFRDKQKALEDFFSESRGRRKGKRSGEIDYLSRHGDIVDALYSWRTSRGIPNGGRVVKNVLIDMGIEVGLDLVEVYEVKTSAGRSSVYTAIGQLMVHGTSDDCRRVIVLPERDPLVPELANALRRLNIELLKFELDEESATIR